MKTFENIPKNDITYSEFKKEMNKIKYLKKELITAKELKGFHWKQYNILRKKENEILKELIDIIPKI